MKKARRYACTLRISQNLASQARRGRCFSTIVVLTSLATGAPALAEELQKSRASQRSSAARQITGPEENLQQAAASGASIIFRLVPAVSHPGGEYPHGGAYSEADINGSELTVFAGPAFHSFWELYISDWDPDYDPANGPVSGQELRVFQARVQSAGFSSGDGGPLDYPQITCASTADCRDQFSIQNGPVCESSFCRPAFIDRTRPDGFRTGHPEACGPPTHDAVIGGTGPVFFGANEAEVPADGLFCALRDPHEPVYLGTLALEVPADALGTYTLEFLDSETIAAGNAFVVHLPILARIPGVLHVVECTSNTDCGAQNACVQHTCNNGRCENAPLFDPETQCCHPASGAVWPLPADLPCRVYSCGSQTNQVVSTEVAPGTPCVSDDPCMENTACVAGGACRGPENVGTQCPKPRYITMDLPDTSAASALRVTLASLNRPDPIYDNGTTGGQFAAFEGQYRWVGPVGDCPNALGQPAYKCAKLQCEPHYADWSAELAGAMLHVTGDAMIPSSIYEVDQLGPDCMGMEESCSSVTALPDATTSRWGRVWGPFVDGAGEARPNINDIVKVVDTLKGVTGSLHKSRVQLSGSDVNPSAALTVIDVGQAVDAVKGFGYPFAGPSSCAP